MSKSSTDFLLPSIENKENIHLIWLDNSLCSPDIQSKLLELNSSTRFSTNIEQCITLIKLIKDEQIILIVSNSFAETILPQIHSYPLLISVFIFSSNKNDQQSMELMNKHKKILQIHSEYELLMKSIEETINILEQQIFSFNIFNQTKDYSNDLSKDSASFLWYQLLIDTLRQIPDNEQIQKNILDKSNEYYQNELKKEKSFQLFNKKNQIYKILNKALRIKDFQVIYLFKHFLIYFYDQIQLEKSKYQNQEILKLYSGQKIFKTDFDKLNKHIGFFISFNHFLSASFNRDNSIKLAKNRILTDEYQSVIFQIEISSTYQQITFAENDDKQDLIFNIDTFFKINSIEFDSSLQLWKINLINDDTNRKKIEAYLQSVKSFTNENFFFIFFGQLFIELDRLNQSEIYFYILLNSLPDDHENNDSVYNQIGNFFAEKGQLKLALENYQHAYQIRQKRLSNDHPHIAISLNNIGLVYKDQGDFDKALDYCQKALLIDEKNYPHDHVLKAMTIENIGGIYKEKHCSSISQTYLLRALNMYKCSLPPNHHFLTDILNSLGKVYCDQGYFDRALKCYQKAFSISEINYSNEHLQKAQTIENIALLYKTNGMLEKSLEELFKALDMYRLIYSNEHHDIARCFGHIGLVYEAKNDFNSALDYFNKQLNMDEKCLSNDHQNINIDINWIIDIYKKKGEINNALEFCQKKFQEKLNSLGENHSMTLAILMTMIDLSDDPIAKSNYYKQALAIHEKLTPYDQREIIKCLDGMVNFYFKNDKIQEALHYQIRMIDLKKEILADRDIDLALSLQRLGELYEALSNTDQAEKCYMESGIIFKKHEDNYNNVERSNLYHEKREYNFRKSRICILQ